MFLGPAIKELSGLEGDVLEQFTSLTGILIVVGLFIFIRVVFVAPFLLYRRQKQEIAELEAERERERARYQREIDQLKQEQFNRTVKERADERNRPVPLLAAVDYILKESQWGRGKTEAEAVAELLRYAAGGTITITAQHKWKGVERVNTYSDPIKAEKLAGRRFVRAYGDFASPALVENTGNSDTQETTQLGYLMRCALGRDVYYHPTVAMDEIKRHFNPRQ